ncbi:MAG: sugar phosphate nucleotidyltransferase [bacterium]
MRAVVMAGGLGTRLRPLTTAVPKPLLPVVGRPMVEHTLRLLRAHGSHEVTLTVQHLSTALRRYFGDGSEFGVDLRYATEHRPLGTAGGVRLAAADGDEDLLVVSGDAVTDLDLTALRAFHDERGADLTVCTVRRSDPREFGLVETDADGRVTRFHEKPAWGGVFGDTVSTGIYVVSPRVLRDMPADREWDWSQDVIPRLIADGRGVYAMVGEGYWEDVGDLPAYRRVQVDALERRVRLDIPGHEVRPGVWLGEGVSVAATVDIEGPAYLGSRSTVEGGARIGAHSVLGSGCIVRASADLDRVVIHDNVYVGSGALLRGCVVGRGCQVGALSRIDEAAVLSDDCTLEQEVEVGPGTLVYPGKTLESGSIVEGTVAWDSRGRRRLLARGGASGTLGVDMTPETAVRLALALVSMQPEDAVVSVGHDDSPAGRAFATIVAGAVSAAGTDVRSLGAVPTPTWRHDTRVHADAGILARTPGHARDRLDLLMADARGHHVSESQARHLERIHDRRDYRRQVPGLIGALASPPGVLEEYAEHLVHATRLDGVGPGALTVVVDSGGSAAGRVITHVLQRTGVDLVSMGQRSGDATASADPLAEIAGRVLVHGADLGIRIDEHGERLTLVDETGHVLSDERALLVVMDLVAAEAPSGHVNLPVQASRIAESVAHFHGLGVRRVPSDGTYIPDDGAVLAADGRGGFAIAGAGPYPDAVATTLALVGLVARTRLTLSAIDARIPRSVMLTKAVSTPWSSKARAMAAVQSHGADREQDATEGVRVVEGDGAWCLVVPDAREALVRLWVEAAEESRACTLLDEWTEVVRAAAP